MYKVPASDPQKQVPSPAADAYAVYLWWKTLHENRQLLEVASHESDDSSDELYFCEEPELFL